MTELLVAMSIFGILLVVVVGIFISFTRATSTARSLDGNVRQASNAMNEMSRVIRAGTPSPVQNANALPAFSQANTEALTVYAFVNLSNTTNAPVKVQFSLDASRRLVETTTQSSQIATGYWSFNGTVTSRIVAGSIAATPSGKPALFTYTDASGLPVTPDNTGVISSTLWASVASVTITLRVKSSTTSNDIAVQLQNTVGMPNVTNSGTVS